MTSGEQGVDPLELTAQERHVLEYIEGLIKHGNSVAQAAETAKIMIDQDDLVDRMVEYRQEIAKKTREWAKKGSLFDPEDEGVPWYTGPGGMDVFWPDLRHLLSSDPSWVDAVVSLDRASTDIVGLLGDPHSSTIRTRGMVLGFVQSGKTANFTASIAKAADAGYRLFIVLSGVHNSLRRQTQLRIDEHLVDRHPARWVGLTDEHRDFGKPVKALPLLTSPDLRLIAVVKKNVSRLTRLRDWLREAQKHGGLDSCPILIIDDEADQASPNAAKDPELDRTRINLRITELLALPRVAYVGYTATPFANVLVNPGDATDIYPRSFIYSLDKPATYFGSRELFGQPVSEDELTSAAEPHDVIRIISDEEAARHSSKILLADGPEVTKGLADAITWFILATAARRIRTGVIKHSSMLVHTTMRVDPQLAYVEPITDFVKSLAGEVSDGRHGFMRDLWDTEITREPAHRHGLASVTFDQIDEVLLETIDEVKVRADNGKSTDRLVYGDEPATVIAVGGNTLSRGLTLEGLVSSFFLRSSSTYDTLLQMGRWFGYRPGYGDLPRIWTTQQLADDFEFLAGIEDSIRTEIARYSSMDGATPANLPVRIRMHPKMQATSRNKMHFAVQGDASFSAQRPQTTYFAHRDEAVLAKNLAATRNLLQGIKAIGVVEEATESRAVLRGVGVERIRQFIGSYSFHADSELTSALLTKYIDGQTAAGALKDWNVVVMGVKSSQRLVSLGLDSDSPLIKRSRLVRPSTDARAVIGTLMSKPDRVADLVPATSVRAETTDRELQELRDTEGRALLLIYPIDKDSQPKQGTNFRESLGAKDDLIGVALCFPTAVAGSEHDNTIQVHLPELLEAGSDFGAEYEDLEESKDDVSLGDG